MTTNVYKWCAVPQCTNTSIKNPGMLFVYVPHNKTIRKKWLNLARRDPTAVGLNSPIYFCGDHFDLPNDMENYMEYHVMGLVSQIRMKPGCIPTKFECQPDRRKRTSDTIERPHLLKKKRKTLIEECEKDLEELNVRRKHLELRETSSTSSVLHSNIENIIQEEVRNSADKSVQVHITNKFRSKAIQTEIKLVDPMTSPFRPTLKSVSTSPFQVERCSTAKLSTSSLQKFQRKMFTIEDQSDSDISYTPSSTHIESSPSKKSLQIKSTSDCSELNEEEKKQEATKIVEYTLLKISKNPRFYIGVPKSCYFLLDLIAENTSIPINHILMCLKKIRLNNLFRELASKLFLKNMPVLASVMRPFIVQVDNENIKNNLPMAFRHKYHHTTCIIDCLEIEVQKPSKALNQSMSWSE